MPWNSTFPLGSVSVRSNETIGQQNTTYTEVTMGNSIVGTNTVTTRDHFWNVGANQDGRHRFIQSPGFTVGALPTDPVIGTGMDGVSFFKLLTAIQSTAQQDVQPFYRNTTQVMQLLGIRAMGVFTGSSSTPSQSDVLYSHNLKSQSGTKGIVRTDTGKFTITFSTAMPSENYLVLGLCIRNSSTVTDDMYMYIPAATAVTNSKSTTRVKIAYKTPDGSHHDPLQAWFVCFGG
jgi:hypothetical protein